MGEQNWKVQRLGIEEVVIWCELSRPAPMRGRGARQTEHKHRLGFLAYLTTWLFNAWSGLGIVLRSLQVFKVAEISHEVQVCCQSSIH